MRKPSKKALEQARLIASHLNYAQSLEASGGDTRRLDADETVALALALEDLRTRVYETEYPETKARQIIPVSTDINSGAESFSWREENGVGSAKIITNYSDDLPTVELTGTKQTASIVDVGDSYYYTIQDLRRAAFMGIPLSQRKADLARRVYEEAVDRIAAFGAPTEGIATGLLNKAMGTADGQIRNVAVTATAWDATPDAAVMVAEANAAVASMISVSEERHTPDTLVLPTLQYQRFSQTFTADGTAESAMERFLKSNGFVKRVIPWNLLKGVDGSSGNNSRGLLLQSSPDVLELIIAQEFSVLPAQAVNLGFKFFGYGRTAGTVVYRPMGLTYLSGLPNT